MNSGDYPPGAIYDRNAPWNEVDCPWCNDGVTDSGDPCHACDGTGKVIKNGEAWQDWIEARMEDLHD